MNINIFDTNIFEIKYHLLSSNRSISKCISCDKTTDDYYVFIPRQEHFNDYHTFGVMLHKACFQAEKLLPTENFVSKIDKYFKNFEH